MTDLLVLCPTRGRPEAAMEAYQSFVDTAQMDSSDIMFVIDDDDPKRPEYTADLGKRYLNLVQPTTGTMVGALNAAAKWTLKTLSPKYLGFIGDDHRFRTPGWDVTFISLLHDRGGGMVYGNDLIRTDGDIPTQIFMSSEIVQALGWMGLPTCKHLYIDNAWRVIGDELGMLFYMPDIVIEHLHPTVGKADWDEGHLRVNAREMYDHDGEAFAKWLSGDAKNDIKRVRAAIQ